MLMNIIAWGPQVINKYNIIHIAIGYTIMPRINHKYNGRFLTWSEVSTLPAFDNQFVINIIIKGLCTFSYLIITLKLKTLVFISH